MSKWSCVFYLGDCVSIDVQLYGDFATPELAQREAISRIVRQVPKLDRDDLQSALANCKQVTA